MPTGTRSDFYGGSMAGDQDRNDTGELWSAPNFLTQIMGFSVIASLFSNTYAFGSVKLLVLGSIIETGRRLCRWLFERLRFQYSITAQFDEGDPSYDWIILFLTEHKVWRRSRDFRVTAKSSGRKWGVETGPNSQPEGSADYVPTYELPQLFRWNGYWLEIKRSKGTPTYTQMGAQSASIIFITVYTLDMAVVSQLVEAARLRYVEVSRPNVIVHTADTEQPHFGPTFTWNNVKRKIRRPLDSIILEEGVIDSIVGDAREFLDMEDWYIDAGIPHRRGYLLYGPPGTGKSSTIHALAGELGMEIYSLSLAAGFVDDSFLQRAASSIPKRAIFLIEDIDCAFPSREEGEHPMPLLPAYPGMMGLGPRLSSRMRSAVTLSGLLNVIDGVGSEEGKLFFATTNYIDHLDPALLRPGRIDRKIQYKLATREQATALFLRFFPQSYITFEDSEASSVDEKQFKLGKLAKTFSQGVPEYEFSTAELQGYLLSCKKHPEQAAAGIGVWVEQERIERKERKEREIERKAKEQQSRDEVTQMQFARMGGLGMMSKLGGGRKVVPISLSQPDMAFTDGFTSDSYSVSVSTLPIPA
ncbi:hypothetical protein K443DRAFT_132188 [Laccaria amethystina LaAM-08-1]|uniref:P-loop containing nucleoside triphosphate hydrolase protein n=1 Tax=Laccaria amethystina LaAM-08-1 TaxID=1095629 RepID=A0A0C9WSF7_9AGAR|nr:hypothetical protein K443DRAFT_132188 [Laccaria amethystina LaAM-08-1]